MKFFIFLDYDGTLSPINRDPKKAFLPQKTKDILIKISKEDNCKIAIISGREIKDLICKVGIKNIIYSGNHGLEMFFGEKIEVFPEAKKALPVIKKIKKEIIRKIKFKGVFLEDKGVSLSLHYRNMRGNFKNLEKAFENIISKWKRNLCFTSGKKVFEIRPAFNWDKGKAVEWIIKKTKSEKFIPIYIGDDNTDEDAFGAVNKKGISVFVGKQKNTLANFFVDDIKGVRELLLLILEGCRESKESI